MWRPMVAATLAKAGGTSCRGAGARRAGPLRAGVVRPRAEARLGAVLVDEAPRDELGPCQQAPRRAVDGEDADEDPVGREQAAVPEDDVLDVTDAEAVDEDVARADVLPFADPAPAHLHDVPVLDDHR